MGTHNGVKILSQMSGLSEDSVTGIWEQVKANHARLQACPNHEFHKIESTDAVRAKYRCSRCAGEIDSAAHQWYVTGRAHAGAT